MNNQTDENPQNTITIGTEEILSLIPHRPPFLFVDKVVDFVKGESCIGFRKMRPDEVFFAGHFPNYPIMPGVLLIEALAQTAAILVSKSIFQNSAQTQKPIFLMSIEKAKFRNPVFPNDEITLYVTKEKNHGSVWKFKGIAKKADKIMAESLITAMITQ